MEQIGKYKVLEELGRGGFGAVYLCEDNLGEKVAVKVFDPEHSVQISQACLPRAGPNALHGWCARLGWGYSSSR